MPQAFQNLAKIFYETVRERSLKGTLQGLLLGIVFLPLLFLYLPIAFQLSYVNFTYGVNGLDPVYKAGLGQIFLSMFIGVFIFEIAVRGLLLRQMFKRMTWPKALGFHLIALNLLAVPFLIYFKWSFGMIGALRGLLLENLLMAFWALFFLKTGSLLFTSLMHAGELFLRMVILNDVAARYETLYFYSAASDDFYWMMIAFTLLPVSLMVLMNQKLTPLELGKRS